MSQSCKLLILQVQQLISWYWKQMTFYRSRCEYLMKNTSLLYYVSRNSYIPVNSNMTALINYFYMCFKLWLAGTTPYVEKASSTHIQYEGGKASLLLDFLFVVWEVKEERWKLESKSKQASSRSNLIWLQHKISVRLRLYNKIIIDQFGQC